RDRRRGNWRRRAHGRHGWCRSRRYGRRGEHRWHCGHWWQRGRRQRLGQDWCWFGEPRAKAYLDKIASFYASEGVANIVDGYNLDGTPHPERPERTEQAASFVGPAGVAFMS